MTARHPATVSHPPMELPTDHGPDDLFSTDTNHTSTYFSFLPYTPRATFTFFLIHFEIIVGLALAFTIVLPTRPYLLPLAFILPIAISIALHNVIKPSALPAYNVALRAALKTTRPIMPGITNCTKCQLPRPPRTHHCRTCKQCVPRMSHHCDVLGVCIGAHNYKPFVFLIVLGFISTSLLAWFSISLPPVLRLLGFYRRFRFPPLPLLLRLQAIYVQFSVAIALAFVVTLHLRLIALNVTVLEAWTSTPIWQAVLPFAIEKTHAPPHHRGLKRNVTEVLGTGWKMVIPMVDLDHVVRVVLTPMKPPI